MTGGRAPLPPAAHTRPPRRSTATGSASCLGPATRACGLALGLLALVGCLHGNNAPSGEVEVRVSSTPDGALVSWPAGHVVELQVGRCAEQCAERTPADPTSEFSELVPAPVFSEVAWHVSIPEGAPPPVRVGLAPPGGTEIVPFTAPDTSTGTWAVFVVVEADRGGEVLTQAGVALLN